MFGLPFPNPHAAEWRAKSAYIAAKHQGVEGGKGGTGGTGVGGATGAGTGTGMRGVIGEGIPPESPASTFYTNTTMRAVNQAVGRAIRHRADYAAVMLVDARYDAPRIRKRLPGWMCGSLVSPTGTGNGAGARRTVDEVVRGLRGFFEGRIGS